jgi:hypothetical protein
MSFLSRNVTFTTALKVRLIISPSLKRFIFIFYNFRNHVTNTKFSGLL